ncbi:MAG: hypothetical protein ACHQIK_20525 [Candidatus Acidiferrales bacterium]
MALTLSDVRQELEKARKQLDVAKKATKEAKLRESELTDYVASLVVVEQQLEPAPKPKTADLQVVASSLVENADDGNKAETIRTIVEHSPEGVSPAEIRALLKEMALNYKDTYVYSVLLRAKKSGKIRERNGKYYPAVEETKKAVAS